MWHPNWKQWVVIWITVFLASGYWIGAESGQDQEERLAKTIVVVGALVVWMLQRPKAE